MQVLVPKLKTSRSFGFSLFRDLIDSQPYTQLAPTQFPTLWSTV